jgi:hypothetical protein
LRVTFKAPGTYEYLCTVPGHAAAGSKGLLTVTVTHCPLGEPQPRGRALPSSETAFDPRSRLGL